MANISPYMIMAIMAGFSIGMSATYIVMSQIGPLREKLKDAKKQCADLFKENEELKKRENIQPVNQYLVKDNANSQNDLDKIDKDNKKVIKHINKGSDENNKSLTEGRRNLAPMIMVIMVLFSFGISATYIIMSQTTPLREQLIDETRNVRELSKEIEEIKKDNNNFQIANDNFVKETANLKGELNKKIIDNEKIRKQLINTKAENNELYLTIDQWVQYCNTIQQQQNDAIIRELIKKH